MGIVDREVRGGYVPGDAALEVDAQIEALCAERDQVAMIRIPDSRKPHLRAPMKSTAVCESTSRPQRVLRTPATCPARLGLGCEHVAARHDVAPIGAATGARRLPWAHRVCARRQVAGRVKKKHDQEVAHRGEAEVEGEALDRPDAQPEQHDCGEQRHDVGGDDRAPDGGEAPRRGVGERAAVARLVTNSLEVHDVRVDRDTDRRR